jgi:hypothetical protein
MVNVLSGATAISEPAQADARMATLKIAILLPQTPDVRQVQRGAELAAALTASHPASGQQVQVTIGLPIADDRQWQATEQRIRSRVPEAIVRHLSWTRVPVDNAFRMFANLPESLDLEGIGEVCVPRDWGWNFADCDFWLSLASPAVGAILPLKPVIHYVGDLAERYVPEAVAASIHDAYWDRQVEAFRMWRQGVVCTSDPDTVEDLISYAGVRRHRIELVPDVLDILPDIQRGGQAVAGNGEIATVLWLQRGSAVDDLHNAVQGLASYVREGGRLKIVRACDASHGMSDRAQSVRFPADLLKAWYELPCFFYRAPEELERMLGRADAVWSSQIAGGEGEHVHDAARAGLPLMAPSFGLTRRVADRLSASAILYDLDDPLAITEALHGLERALAGGESEAERRREQPDVDERRTAFGFLVDRGLEQVHAR